MREILFRGKTNEGRWVEGAYFKHDTVKVCFSSDDPEPRNLIIQDGFCDWGFEPPIHCVDVDPETVGQYTGMTDKNGKKIFEGDICRIQNLVYKVEFKYSEWVFTILSKTVYCFPAFSSHCGKYCEVIGNIHDNPDLLKGGGE